MQMNRGVKSSILISAVALVIGSCGNQTYVAEGYLIQSGNFGVFSSNSKFSPAYRTVAEGGPYATFKAESLDALRGHGCPVKMYYVKLSGVLDVRSREITADQFDVIKEIPVQEARKIAMSSENTVVSAMQIC